MAITNGRLRTLDPSAHTLTFTYKDYADTNRLKALTLTGVNVHSRCNLGARHRWGIESGLLVEKHHGYQYEHCFSYTWEAMRGYHYLMRLGHALNVLARYSAALAKYVRDLGVRGLIDFVRQSLANPWLKVEELQQIATAPCQIRLE